MYSLVSLLSGIYPLPAMHSLLVTLCDKIFWSKIDFFVKKGENRLTKIGIISYYSQILVPMWKLTKVIGNFQLLTVLTN